MTVCANLAMYVSVDEVQKQMLGEKLYPAIARFQPELAGALGRKLFVGIVSGSRALLQDQSRPFECRGALVLLVDA